MEIELFNANSIKVWKGIATKSSQELLQVELELYKKLFIYFQVGDCYFLIFNFERIEFDFVGPEVVKVLGYQPNEVTVKLMMDIIHQDDRAWFFACQDRTALFLKSLPMDRLMKYKLRFDCRFRRKDGSYVRLMQQVVVAQVDELGSISRTLIVHTDISHLKQQGKPVLSFIGMEDEPSYLDIDVSSEFLVVNSAVSKREREILKLLIQGNQSKQIAAILSISKFTVDTHRRNIMRRNQIKSTAELISKAINNGWV